MKALVDFSLILFEEKMVPESYILSSWLLLVSLIMILTLIFLSTEGDCGCLFLERIQQGTLLISYTLGRERCCFFLGEGE